MPVLLLPYMSLTRPPALKKYRAAAADAKVTVCVNVIVHDDVLDPVAAVLEVVPEKVPIAVPDAAALPLLLVRLVKSVFTLLRIVIKLPVTGAVLEVIDVP